MQSALHNTAPSFDNIFHLAVKLPTIQYNSDTEETEADTSRLLPLTVDCVPVTTSFVMVAG